MRALRNLMKAHPDRLEFGLGKDEFIAAAQFPVPNDERDLTALIGYDLGADNYFPMELKAESFMNWLERFSVESMNILLESENNNVDEPGSH